MFRIDFINITIFEEINFESLLRSEICLTYNYIHVHKITGRDFLNIPIFAKAIEKCDKVLKPRGVDIYKVLIDEDPKIFDNIANCQVGIAAVQV